MQVVVSMSWAAGDHKRSPSLSEVAAARKQTKETVSVAQGKTELCTERGLTLYADFCMETQARTMKWMWLGSSGLGNRFCFSKNRVTWVFMTD